MKTIKKDLSNEIIIQKSRFICECIKISSEIDVKKVLEKIKVKYKDATHYCYAYIISNTKRFQDDGEPSGTAGKPILNVLESNELTNILCIVIRYFGGIKLGAGGLVRAYTKAVTETIHENNIKLLIPTYLIEFTFSYEDLKMMDYILNDMNILDKKFETDITYLVHIPVNGFDRLKPSFDKICSHISILDKFEI